MSKSFVGASRKRPCPLCGRREWPCYWRSDESVVWCKTVVSDKTDRLGRYCHVLKFDSARPTTPAPSAKPTPRPALASQDRRHLVYSELLALLPLHPPHFDKLLSRGLSPEAIEVNGYKSTPARDEGDALAVALADYGLNGVPGFFHRRGSWRLRWCRPGYFVPYRDGRGRILGLSYRLDEEAEDGAKYLWLSTNPEDTFEGGGQKYPRGTKLCAPVHVAGREWLPSASEVWLTEGALKGDVAAHLLRVPFLCAGGVTQWGEGFERRFKNQFPGRRAVVAFDADWRTKREVRHALESLMARLRDAGVSYVVRSWPNYPEAKGIDDLALVLSQSRGEGVRAA